MMENARSCRDNFNDCREAIELRRKKESTEILIREAFVLLKGSDLQREMIGDKTKICVQKLKPFWQGR